VSNYNTLYQVGAPTFSGLTAGQGTVVVLDTATNSLVPGATIPVGQSPANVIVRPGGDRVYVSNYTSNTIDTILAL
jgi:YVTN family beta-propeller protein